jgi:hypothetical protein
LIDVAEAILCVPTCCFTSAAAAAVALYVVISALVLMHLRFTFSV